MPYMEPMGYKATPVLRWLSHFWMRARINTRPS